MTPRYPWHIRKLRASLTGTRKGFAGHRKMCARCSNAHKANQPALYCDTGYEWFKDEWRFIRQLERAGHPELAMRGDQLALF